MTASDQGPRVDETTRLQALPSVLDHRVRSKSARIPRLAPGAYLVLEEGEDLTVVELEREVTHIGRGFSSDLRLEHAAISRRHALVIRHGDEFSILDDRSANGVFVNGDQVQRVALRDRDRIGLGEAVELVFVRVV